MAEFFRINSKAIKAPTEITCSADSLDKEERTVDGTMVVDLVGSKRKLDVSWEFLSKEDMKLLSAETKSGTFVTVTYNDSTTGELTSMTARAKDLQYQPYYDWAKSRLMWKGVSISFVER